MFKSHLKHVCCKTDILNHCEVTYFATNTPIEMKYTDRKAFVLVMLFLIQAHN